jgi:LmbE family N-acetylglucosaminyl deacetylase
MNLFVSAHLDDAVLSCGGTIAAQTRMGTEVVVATVYAGDSAGELSPLAARLHARWQLTNGVEMRRREDAEACRILGADPLHLPFPNALYRNDSLGRPRCATIEDLYSSLTADDQPEIDDVVRELERLLAELRPQRVYGPAGFGDHIDHVITSLALQQAVANAPDSRRPHLLLYEDLPYAFEAVDDRDPRSLDPAAAVISRFTDADWQRKVQAIGAYQSQLEMLWQDKDWPALLRRHASAVTQDGVAERQWSPRRPVTTIDHWR